MFPRDTLTCEANSFKNSGHVHTKLVSVVILGNNSQDI